MDERSIVHRLKASRMALISGLLVMFVWFQIDLFGHRIVRWDFLIVMGVMAIAKVAARLVYRKSN